MESINLDLLQNEILEAENYLNKETNIFSNARGSKDYHTTNSQLNFNNSRDSEIENKLNKVTYSEKRVSREELNGKDYKIRSSSNEKTDNNRTSKSSNRSYLKTPSTINGDESKKESLLKRSGWIQDTGAFVSDSLRSRPSNESVVRRGGSNIGVTRHSNDFPDYTIASDSKSGEYPMTFSSRPYFEASDRLKSSSGEPFHSSLNTAETIRFVQPLLPSQRGSFSMDRSIPLETNRLTSSSSVSNSMPRLDVTSDQRAAVQTDATAAVHGSEGSLSPSKPSAWIIPMDRSSLPKKYLKSRDDLVLEANQDFKGKFNFQPTLFTQSRSRSKSITKMDPMDQKERNCWGSQKTVRTSSSRSRSASIHRKASPQKGSGHRMASVSSGSPPTVRRSRYDNSTKDSVSKGGDRGGVEDSMTKLDQYIQDQMDLPPPSEVRTEVEEGSFSVQPRWKENESSIRQIEDTLSISRPDPSSSQRPGKRIPLRVIHDKVEEMLKQHERRKQERQQQKRDLDRLEMSECTFAPQIPVRSERMAQRREQSQQQSSFETVVRKSIESESRPLRDSRKGSSGNGSKTSEAPPSPNRKDSVPRKDPAASVSSNRRDISLYAPLPLPHLSRQEDVRPDRQLPLAPRGDRPRRSGVSPPGPPYSTYSQLYGPSLTRPDPPVRTDRVSTSERLVPPRRSRSIEASLERGEKGNHPLRTVSSASPAVRSKRSSSHDRAMELSDRLHRDAERRSRQQQWLERKVDEVRMSHYPFAPLLHPNTEKILQRHDPRHDPSNDPRIRMGSVNYFEGWSGDSRKPLHERVNEIIRLKKKRLQQLQQQVIQEGQMDHTFVPSIDPKSKEIAERKYDLSTPALLLGGPDSLETSEEGVAVRMGRGFHEDVATRLLDGGKASIRRKQQLLQERDRILSDLLDVPRVSRGSQKIAEKNEDLRAPFEVRQARFEEKRWAKERSLRMETSRETESWFVPNVNHSMTTEILAQSRPDRLQETTSQRIERWSTLDAMAREQHRKELERHVYKDLTFRPTIDPVSQVLGRESDVHILSENLIGKHIKQRLKLRAEARLSQECTFRPLINDFRGKGETEAEGRGGVEATRTDRRSDPWIKPRINLQDPEKMTREIRLHLLAKEEKRRQEVMERELLDLKDCTFQPEITSYPPRSTTTNSQPIVVRGLGRHLELRHRSCQLKEDLKEREKEVFGVKNLGRYRRAEDGSTIVEVSPFL